jgi:hypothetical protein
MIQLHLTIFNVPEQLQQWINVEQVEKHFRFCVRVQCAHHNLRYKYLDDTEISPSFQ